MSKSPAFQFYAADFLTDTAEMSDQEVGVYIRLLSHQWINGSLHSDPNRLANGVAIGVLEVWTHIKHKFCLCEDGRLRNPRLEETRQLQKKYKQNQSDAGKIGAAKRWGKNGDPIGDPIGETIALQSSSSKETLPNGNESSSSDDNRSNGVPYKKFEQWYKTSCPNMTGLISTSWTASRKTTLRNAWLKNPDQEWWESFLEYCGESRFLSGDNPRGWKADLFWIVKPENFAKINEGKYHGKT